MTTTRDGFSIFIADQQYGWLTSDAPTRAPRSLSRLDGHAAAFAPLVAYTVGWLTSGDSRQLPRATVRLDDTASTPVAFYTAPPFGWLAIDNASPVRRLQRYFDYSVSGGFLPTPNLDGEFIVLSGTLIQVAVL